MSDLSKYSIIYMPDDADSLVGVIELIHDFGEHQGRYREFAHFFTSNGYAVITGDLRGHGNNIKRNAELGFLGDNAVSRLVGDIHENRIYVKERFPGIPYFIAAIGVGGLIATSYFKKYDNFLDGMFLFGMPSERTNTLPLLLLVKLFIALKGEYHRSRIVSSIINGRFINAVNKNSSDFSWLSNDNDVINQYQSDPKCGFTPTLNAYLALLELFEAAYTKGSWIHKKNKCPIRLFSGSHDPYVISKSSFVRTAHMFSNNGYKNVAYIQYPGLRHDLFHGDESDEILEDFLKELDNIRTAPEEKTNSEEPVNIVLEDFIDPDINKPIEKEEKINLEDFIYSKSKKNAGDSSKVEMIDYQDINTYDIDLDSIISTVKDNENITYEPMTNSSDDLLAAKNAGEASDSDTSHESETESDSEEISEE